MKAFALAGIAVLLAPVAGVPVAAGQTVWQGYQLGAEDQIEVQIHGQGGATVKTRVKSDGSITLPLVGRVRAADQTTQSLATAIEGQLKRGGLIMNPIVNVEILEYASRTVTMLGEFANPGLVPLDRPLTLTEIVARVGGLKAGASDDVVLRRAGGTIERYNLTAIARNEARDIVLSPGDALFATAAPQYYIYGQVGNAGSFAIAPQMTIRQALARAGGPTLAGSERKITLFRGGQEIDADLSAFIQPRDVLFVRERVF
ncbi:polysaccharide biosynthesis/export family protein [Sphingomonas yantingensis]|uniref:Polysaccharide export outer membrane protein n=1 Tax=Sphingomonas yantingensis TaxID=1241761 RepID=A0A7W9ARW9_9SPHN|nr:polysaccharide biosynthesis/export family protein [Sphingomonas yantingensis]MBB5699306.1 polysaccharide export outer membrane protein [Sphingomonas yantingensis]